MALAAMTAPSCSAIAKGGWPWQAGASAAGKGLSLHFPAGLGSPVQVTTTVSIFRTGISHWQSSLSRRRVRNRSSSGVLKTNQKNLENQFFLGADDGCRAGLGAGDLGRPAASDRGRCSASPARAVWGLPHRSLLSAGLGVPRGPDIQQGSVSLRSRRRSNPLFCAGMGISLRGGGGSGRSPALLGPTPSPGGLALRRAFYLVPSPQRVCGFVNCWLQEFPCGGSHP